MTFEEILSELIKFEDTDEYKTFVNGLINDDRVTNYLETESGKKLLQPRLDSYFTKGLATWRENNLDKLVNDKVKELYPEADPKDTELAAVKAELEKIKTESLRKDLKNKALKTANEKGLPVDLIDFFVGSDEKQTNENLTTFEKVFTSAVGSAAEKKLKGQSYVPPEGDSEEIDGVTAAFAKLNPNLKITTNMGE